LAKSIRPHTSTEDAGHAKAGTWNWSNFDACANAVLTNQPGCKILYTLGQTPVWAALNTNTSSGEGPGATSEPRDMNDWSNYVRSVGLRYKGMIQYYEIWNEADAPNFYSGAISNMLTMAQNAWVGFQALTSWRAPFTGSSNTTNATPADGLDYAFKTYGCAYFELYVDDLDWPAYQPALANWAAILVTPLAQRAPKINAASGDFTLSWQGMTAAYGIERASLPIGPWATVTNVTDHFEWTDHGAARSVTSGFYRIRGQ
jgi:hypothetical protein